MPEKGKSKYSERALESKTVKRRVVTVGSSEEIPFAEMSDDDDYVEVSEKEIANVSEESFVVCVTARGDVIRGAVIVTQLK